MKRFVQSFPFLMVMAVCGHAACGDSEQGTGSTGVGPVGAQGTGYHPACNLDRRDGYCNMLGDNPESCECFDCVDSAKCTGKCTDNGSCEAGEDCTCIDCNAGECAPPAETTGEGPGPATTTTGSTGGDGGGSPATTTTTTTNATTTTGMGGMGNGGAGGA